MRHLPTVIKVLALTLLVAVGGSGRTAEAAASAPAPASASVSSAVPAAVPALATTAVITPEPHRRGEEQTFLTYPEWFLVHGPAELADYLNAQRPPSGFPWWGQVEQFWQGYAAVTRETAAYPFNAGYHAMVFVIGSSTTVEYGLRQAYESTVGFLSEASAGGAVTEEDALAARVAQRYVDFIRVDPWYLFDFVAPMRELWTQVPASGPHLLRKWERRFLLTTEYGLKAAYAWLIGLATSAVYDPAKPTTAVVLSAAPGPLPAGLAPVLPLDAAVKPAAPAVLVALPRYRAFMFHAQALADQGLDFFEIAGNRGPILVSVLQPTGSALPGGAARKVLVQPIITRPGQERLLVALPVTGLAAQLRQWKADKVQVEHIYDY